MSLCLIGHISGFRHVTLLFHSECPTPWFSPLFQACWASCPPVADFYNAAPSIFCCWSCNLEEVPCGMTSKGSSIYEAHKKIRFLTSLLPVHMSRTPSPLRTSTCGRHEIHIALLKLLVQWPSRPEAEIRLYDCNLFKTALLIIYITNLYCQKFPLFISSKDKILVEKMPISLHEKKTGWRLWTLVWIFCVDVHMGVDPSPRAHASTPAWYPCGRHKCMAT